MTERIHFLVIHPLMNDWLATRHTRHRLYETIKPNDSDELKNNDGRVISKKLKQEVYLQDSLKRNTYQIFFFESMTGKLGERDEWVDDRYDSIDGLLWQYVSTGKWRNEKRRLVFIGKVHGRRSDVLIRDKDQSENNTCHAP